MGDIFVLLTERNNRFVRVTEFVFAVPAHQTKMMSGSVSLEEVGHGGELGETRPLSQRSPASNATAPVSLAPRMTTV